MKVLDIVVTVLLVIGALNWGLVGFFGFNLVGALFGEATALTRVIYSAVGLCGLYEAYNFTVGYNAMHHRWCDLPVSVRH
jgi:uncharacterized membrane protein YuzA (DUF378 family)